MSTRRWLLPVVVALTIISLPVLLFGMAVMLTYPTLPSLELLTDYHPKVPLRIYSAEGVLLGEFGEERRALVKIADVPVAMKDAILAAEDDRFYQHGGVDYMGVLRAALSNLLREVQSRAQARSPCRLREISFSPRRKHSHVNSTRCCLHSR
jgi:penicillin-binding protein 1A